MQHPSDINTNPNTSDPNTSHTTTTSNANTSHTTTNFAGHPVIDEHGDRLGSVKDVVYDVADRAPEYLVVDPGMFRKAHYVPVEGSYRSVDGDIVVPWAKSWFKLAPTASHTHVLSSQDRHTLEAHYAHH